MRSHNRLNNNAWKIYSQRWLNFSNSSSVQKLDRFLEELDELVETVSQEHETAEEILNNASRVRTRIIVLSLSLSAIAAFISAMVISQAISHPLQTSILLF